MIIVVKMVISKRTWSICAKIPVISLFTTDSNKDILKGGIVVVKNPKSSSSFFDERQIAAAFCRRSQQF
jgi:hypothetical protein